MPSIGIGVHLIKAKLVRLFVEEKVAYEVKSVLGCGKVRFE